MNTNTHIQTAFEANQSRYCAQYGFSHTFTSTFTLSLSLYLPHSLSLSHLHTVWPDVRLKSSPISTKSYPKRSNEVFILKVMFSKIAQKVTKYFEHFWRNICLRELSKFAHLVTLSTHKYSLLLFLPPFLSLSFNLTHTRCIAPNLSLSLYLCCTRHTHCSSFSLSLSLSLSLFTYVVLDIHTVRLSLSLSRTAVVPWCPHLPISPSAFEAANHRSTF